MVARSVRAAEGVQSSSGPDVLTRSNLPPGSAPARLAWSHELAALAHRARPVSVLEAAAILVAGGIAGTINTVVGSGTLVTFPVLLAFGYRRWGPTSPTPSA